MTHPKNGASVVVPMLVVASLAATTASAQEIVYAWADKPTTDAYAAPSNYSYSPGNTVQVTRDGHGQYVVDFGRTAGPGANVQVVAYGTSDGYCNVQQWGGGKANVRCFDRGGRPANRQFLAMAVKAKEAHRGRVAYAWLQNATASSVEAAPNYRFGTGSMQITRTNTGRYTIDLGSPVGQEAAVFATAYNSNANCRVVSWSNGKANVACIRGRTPVDSQLSVLAIGDDLPRASFVWNQSANGQASAQYSHASDESSQSVQRTGAGQYRVDLGPEANVGGHVQAVAYGGEANCWVQNYNNGNANVRCTKNGNPHDTQFVVAAFRPAPATPEAPVAPAPLSEDCVSFNPSTATLKRVNNRWKIVDGDHWMFDFGDNQVEAALAINYIDRYGANQSCFVGRPDPSMTYLLKSGAALSGDAPGEDCVGWNLNTIEVSNAGGTWRLVDGNHSIMSFSNRAEAVKALQVVKKHRFSEQCFVGRPGPSLTYFKR